MKNKKLLSSLGALLCCALWGISTPIVKMGYDYIDKNSIPSLLFWVGLQFAFAGLISIFAYSIFSRRFVHPEKKNIGGVLLVSSLQTIIQYLLLYIGLANTTSVKGAILKSTDVFMVALIASLIFKQEKLTAKKLISVIIGFGGIIIMNLDGLSLNFSLLGDGLVLLAILSYSFSVVIIRIVTGNEDPIVLSGYQMAIGGTVMLIIGVLFGGKMDFVGMFPILACLSAIYAISYVLWTVLLKYNPASSITVYSFTTPVFGVIFSALLLTEAGGVAPINLGIALALVCFGIILWGYEKKK